MPLDRYAFCLSPVAAGPLVSFLFTPSFESRGMPWYALIPNLVKVLLPRTDLLEEVSHAEKGLETS